MVGHLHLHPDLIARHRLYSRDFGIVCHAFGEGHRMVRYGHRLGQVSASRFWYDEDNRPVRSVAAVKEPFCKTNVLRLQKRPEGSHSISQHKGVADGPLFEGIEDRVWIDLHDGRFVLSCPVVREVRGQRGSYGRFSGYLRHQKTDLSKPVTIRVAELAWRTERHRQAV